jgi:hypothetical protein
MANVSYVKGIQSISYTAHDLDPQPRKDISYGITWNSSAELDPLLADVRPQLEERFRYYNALTVYTAFWQVITLATHRICGVWPSSCSEDWQSPNGTRIGIGSMKCRQGERREYFIPRLANLRHARSDLFHVTCTVSTVLEGSRLNPQRLNTSDILDLYSD